VFIAAIKMVIGPIIFLHCGAQAYRVMPQVKRAQAAAQRAGRPTRRQAAAGAATVTTAKARAELVGRLFR